MPTQLYLISTDSQVSGASTCKFYDLVQLVRHMFVVPLRPFLSPRFFKKAKGILLSPPSVRPTVRLSVMLSPPKPLDEIQPNLVCEFLP